jgi:hypothetical protein
MSMMLAEPQKGPGFTQGSAPSSNRERGTQLLYLSLSLIGLIILTTLAFRGSLSPLLLPWQTRFIGAVFMAVCLFGFVAAVSPRSLRGFGHGSEPNPHVRGHHPDCEKFRNHVVWIWGRPYCAGCTGLALGAALSILGSGLYFFLGVFPFNPGTVFWLGALMVTMGLAQHFIDLGSPYLHLFLNVILVCGSFMLAASMDAMGVSFYVEAYHLGLVVFWVASRIRLSQEEHAIICRSCGLGCGHGFSPR